MPGGGAERIFLYGTLRRGASRDATRFYSGVEFIVTARVRGRLYDLGEYPGLRLDGTADWVVGEVFDVTPGALAGLDEWEGIPAGATEGGEYRRLRADVVTEGGGTLPCWVYEVSAERVAGAPVIASGDWLARG